MGHSMGSTGRWMVGWWGSYVRVRVKSLGTFVERQPLTVHRSIIYNIYN
jgi:hypothetical protein